MAKKTYRLYSPTTRSAYVWLQPFSRPSRATNGKSHFSPSISNASIFCHNSICSGVMGFSVRPVLIGNSLQASVSLWVDVSTLVFFTKRSHRIGIDLQCNCRVPESWPVNESAEVLTVGKEVPVIHDAIAIAV